METLNLKKLFFVVLTACAGILSIPLVAMQFTTEVNWDLFDFVVAGILLFSFGLGVAFALKIIGNPKFKILTLVALLLLFLLIWAELAVGIFGSPFAGS